MMQFLKYAIAFVILCCGCSSSEDTPKKYSQPHQKGEYIYRMHDEHLFLIPPPQLNTPEPYAWDQGQVGNNLRITKEFFRCKGSNLNPVRVMQEKGEIVRYYDCGGSAKHSLPLRNGKEFIHPILIDLLNYIQSETRKRVVITSGHRCPEHNTYVDSSPENQYSKHMIGAEVSFYVQGMEEKTDNIIKIIQKYYTTVSKYKNSKDYLEFKRYEKDDVNVSTQPWFNKEIFLKLFKKKEGRNFDNHHPYPYISIQVRYDFETQEKVIYTWDKAFHNYLRH